MRLNQQTTQDVPFPIVGSSTFGRYPKISPSKTYNMIISDNWLVPYAGHEKKILTSDSSQGRGLFTSVRSGKMFFVANDDVFLIDSALDHTSVGTLETTAGDVFIAENNASQIAICDKKNIYIYDYSPTGTGLTKVNTSFTPDYVSFQDGYFIAGVLGSREWRLSDPNNGLSWKDTPDVIGNLQTKPDTVVACVPAPGRGGQLYIMGNTVTEVWMDVGAQLFPYQRTNAFNIDYGCANAATIAAGDTFIVWLGVNEKSGLAIMYSTGGDVEQISSDGINFQLANLKNPTNAYGFLFKQDGHLFYQLTFPDFRDNLTLVYDFNTKKFFHLCDEKMNYHIAKRISFYNDNYYFISLKDGHIYEMNSEFTTYDGEEIPRIRMADSFRLPDQSMFVINNFSFILEQGNPRSQQFTPLQQYKGLIGSSTDFPARDEVNIGDYFNITNVVTDNYTPATNTGKSYVSGEKIVWNGADWALVNETEAAVDLSVSRDGGEVFSSNIRMNLNKQGSRINKFILWGLGAANEFYPQLRFWGVGRFVVSNGLLSIYK